MKKFTKEQPIDGEIILHCAHMNNANKVHWWKFPTEVYFRRPDQTVGTAIWMAVCDKCQKKCAGDPSKIEIAGDLVWDGNDPVIYKNL